MLTKNCVQLAQTTTKLLIRIKDLRKWRDIPFFFSHWKIQYFPDINHYHIDEGNQCNTNQCLVFFFFFFPIEIVRLILNLYWKVKGPQILSTIFKEKSIVEDSVQVSRSVQLFVTPWIAARQGSLSIANSRSLPKLMSIESVMPSNHLIFCRPLLLQPPTSMYFPMSQLVARGGQSIGVSASASVLPMKTQDSSPLGRTGWISLQSKGLSRVFSNTTVQKHQFFSIQLSL